MKKEAVADGGHRHRHWATAVAACDGCCSLRRLSQRESAAVMFALLITTRTMQLFLGDGEAQDNTGLHPNVSTHICIVRVGIFSQAYAMHITYMMISLTHVFVCKSARLYLGVPTTFARPSLALKPTSTSARYS